MSCTTFWIFSFVCFRSYAFVIVLYCFLAYDFALLMPISSDLSRAMSRLSRHDKLVISFLKSLRRKSNNCSVEILDYPRRNEQFLPNFYSFLPKFHIILANFYFAPRWGNFISSGAIGIFLGRDWLHRWFQRSYSVSLYRSTARLCPYLPLVVCLAYKNGMYVFALNTLTRVFDLTAKIKLG